MSTSIRGFAVVESATNILATAERNPDAFALASKVHAAEWTSRGSEWTSRGSLRAPRRSAAQRAEGSMVSRRRCRSTRVLGAARAGLYATETAARSYRDKKKLQRRTPGRVP